MNNTNFRQATTDWRPFPEYGSFFRLKNGALWVCPIRDDGSRDEEPLQVIDWNSGHNAKHGRTLERIVEELLASDGGGDS